MNSYYTISEFAKLRNININSLRYYEKLGLLKPCYVNPDTGYRYYSANQLLTLDIIRLCIELDIPLRKLGEYMDISSHISLQKLIQEGKKRLEEKISRSQSILEQLEESLHQMSSTEEYSDIDHFYERHFPERKIIISSPFESIYDTHQIVSSSEEIHTQLDPDQLFIAHPLGILMHPSSSGNPNYRMFCETSIYPENSHNIGLLPAGIYRCIQAKITDKKRLFSFLSKNFTYPKYRTVIISTNMIGNISLREKSVEIQVPLLPLNL